MTGAPEPRPPFPRDLRRMALGPALTLALSLAFLAFPQILAPFPRPGAFLVLAVVWSTFYGGLRSGLVSALFSWLYFLYGYLTATLLPGVPGGNLLSVVFAAIVFPLVTLLAELMRQRLERPLLEAMRREQEHSRLLEQTLADRERAREELARERNIWQTVLDNVPDYIFVKDAAGRYLLASRAMTSVLGVGAPQDVVGKTDFDFCPPELAEAYRADDLAILESGEPMISREVPGWASAGQEVWSLTTKVPLRDSQDNIVGIVGVARDITARKRAEQALRDAEERYRTLVEQLPAITYIVEFGEQARTTYISPQVQTLLGFTPAEWLADQDLWIRQIHPEDRERVVQEVRRVSEGGERLNLDYRALARGGAVLWVRNQAVHLDGLDGRPRYAHGVMLDITDWKTAEAALRESERRYELVTWATHDAVWDWNLADNTVWWNEGIRRLFQYSLDTTFRLHSWWRGRVHPDDRERVEQSIERAIAGGDQFWSKEYRFLRADDTYADVFDRGYILRDDRGAAVRLVGAMTDVSEQKRVEAALREAEENYRTLVEQLPAVVYVAAWGETGRWLYVSPRIHTLLGFTPQEWLADPGLWARQVHPDDRQRTMADEEQDRLREPGTHTVIEYRMITRDGRTLWVRDSAVILPGDAESPLLYQGVLSDITELKQAQEALQEANQILGQWLQHSERRTMELGLLTELSSLLQNSHSINEACLSVSPILRRLFDDDQVGLYVLPPGGQVPMVEPIWAEGIDGAVPFSRDDCWALRRNQFHLVDAEHPGPACQHVADSQPAAYMCVPIIAQGRPRALLHLRQAPPATGRSLYHRPVIADGQQQLARTVADSMGLAFSNLELRDSLREQSIRDGLTGLYNRRYMEESLEREIYRAARHQATVGIVMLDIDHFKAFNDAHGHLAGDVLLRELGRLLRVHIRGADIACRYGGEEFILILPEASLEVTRQRAEHLWAQARSLRPEFGGRLLDAVTVSMGVAAYPNHGATAEAVLRAADEALYRAKREGRDRVVAR